MFLILTNRTILPKTLKIDRVLFFCDSEVLNYFFKKKIVIGYIYEYNSPSLISWKSVRIRHCPRNGVSSTDKSDTFQTLLTATMGGVIERITLRYFF